MTGLYVTLGIVGGLVGVFSSGMMVALAQAFPGGSAGALDGAPLAGAGVAMVVAGTALGVAVAGLAHGVGWRWARRLAEPAAMPRQSDESIEPVEYSQ